MQIDENPTSSVPKKPAKCFAKYINAPNGRRSKKKENTSKWLNANETVENAGEKLKRMFSHVFIPLSIKKISIITDLK